MEQIYFLMDGLIIPFYRITGFAFIDYLLGTFCLSMAAVLLGEICISLALRMNKRYLDGLSHDMQNREQMALAAYKEGNKAGYKALNREATDVWGKRFFAMVAHSAAILWPIPFVLGWMQTRFQDVAFPVAFPFSLVTDTVGYTFTFFPIYILSRIVFGKIRHRLPYFRDVHRRLLAQG